MSSRFNFAPRLVLQSGHIFSPSVGTTVKLYYGGAQKRPEGQSYMCVKAVNGTIVGHVPEAGRKDVRNAVEAAQRAASGCVTFLNYVLLCWWFCREFVFNMWFADINSKVRWFHDLYVFWG